MIINRDKMIFRPIHIVTNHRMISGFAFLILALLCSNIVSATGLSVNKAVMDFKNVLKGGYAEDTVFVASDSDFDIPLGYQTLGDIKDWISFDPDINTSNATIYVSRTHGQVLKVIIQPPADTPSGNYTGSVRILTGTINKPGGPYGSQLQAAFMITIKVEVTGTQIISCNAGGIIIPDTEIGKPLEYSMTVSNDGNVRVRPNASIDVWNQDQTKLMTTLTTAFNNVEILPTTSRTLSTSFDNNLRIGQYWAYATIAPCTRSELISFSVVEIGSIIDSGELVRIENEPWASIGEIIPITAYFKNSGTRIVSAKFKGIITLNNQIIENLDSDYLDIAPGELSNITVYFTPKKLGQYFISGRVLYNNKLSFEKSSILNVNSGVEEQGLDMVYILAIIIIVLAILLLLIFIRKKRLKLRVSR